ncbi:MAG: RNA polymerase sigma factor RpoD/SigA [Myxococcales bacterium]
MPRPPKKAAAPAPKRRGRPKKTDATPAEPEVEVLGPDEEPSELSDEEVETLAAGEEEPAAEPGNAPAAAPPVHALVKAPAGRLAPQTAMQRYMREVERHPLLSREEEHELAVRLRETGDVNAAYRLVTANLRLVVKIAHEYHRSTFNLLDLIQEGNVGLMHAVRKFDPYRGVKLSSYAAWWIRAYILRYIMENWRVVKLGTTQAQRKLFFNLRKEQQKLIAEGFEPTPKLLAERLNVTEQDVREMDQRMSQDEFSLDAPISDENATARVDRIRATTQPVDERLGEQELKALLRERLQEFGKTLKDKERYIFENRLISEEPMTLQEIGDQYGITRERARQIEAKIVKELREWMRAAMPDFEELEIGERD